jgi:hypothetical protein
MTDAVKVFVGCDPNGSDLEQMMVLEYSLRKNASLPIEIHWMQLSRDPKNPWFSSPARKQGWRTETWSTPFSGFRWAIPATCGYQGRAIYMDTDILVLCDIADVWNMDIKPGKIVAARAHVDSWLSCVMLWDCDAARAYIPTEDVLSADPHSHRDIKKYFARHPELIQPLDPTYNCIDGEGLPVDDIRILHYSDMGTQFSHQYSVSRLAREGREHWFDGEILPHPRKDLALLFDSYLHGALAAGYTLDSYRTEEIFGALVKESQQNYVGNRACPKVSLWSRLSLRKR